MKSARAARRPMSTPSPGKTLLGYGLMLAGAVSVLWAILGYGDAMSAEHSAASQAPASVHKAPPETLLHVLLALVVIIAASRALGALFRFIQQPRVIGEVVAGIVLGPSLLGQLWPAAQGFILPDNVAPYLGIVAQVGVILFMFLVGLELDLALLRGRSHATLAISHASMLLPFLMGTGLALFLYASLAPAGVRFPHFALFMGVSMSVTAFPVLARILTERDMHKTELGVVALSCAAVDDVSAWCLLAAIVGVVRAQGNNALVTLGLTLAYASFMVFAARPLITRLTARQEARPEVSQGMLAGVLIALLVSALITESIGIHALFGAFLLGAIIPHDSSLAHDLTRKLNDLVVVLLLPAFFAFTGMRTQLGLLSGWSDVLICALIVLVACLGKFGGTTLAARLSGIPLRHAAALGVLMNTRGLMELIVLNVGLDLGVISPRLFAMLVVMAIVTTFMTSPLLTRLIPSDPLSHPRAT